MFSNSFVLCRPATVSGQVTLTESMHFAPTLQVITDSIFRLLLTHAHTPLRSLKHDSDTSVSQFQCRSRAVDSDPCCRLKSIITPPCCAPASPASHSIKQQRCAGIVMVPRATRPCPGPRLSARDKKPFQWKQSNRSTRIMVAKVSSGVWDVLLRQGPPTGVASRSEPESVRVPAAVWTSARHASVRVRVSGVGSRSYPAHVTRARCRRRVGLSLP
jgi:hypothetical protein